MWEDGWITLTTRSKAETALVPEDATQLFAFQQRKQRDSAIWTEFHPVSHQLALIRTGLEPLSAQVLNSRTSKYLLHHTGIDSDM